MEIQSSSSQNYAGTITIYLQEQTRSISKPLHTKQGLMHEDASEEVNNLSVT